MLVSTRQVRVAESVRFLVLSLEVITCLTIDGLEWIVKPTLEIDASVFLSKMVISRFAADRIQTGC